MVIVKQRLLPFSVSPRLVYDDNKKTEIQQNIYMAYNTCLAASSNRYHFRCSWLFFQCRTKRSVTQRYVLIVTSSNRYPFRCSWLFFQCRTKRSITQRHVLIEVRDEGQECVWWKIMRITSSLYYKNKSFFIIKGKQYFLVYKNIMCTVIYNFSEGPQQIFRDPGFPLFEARDSIGVLNQNRGEIRD